MSTAPGAFERPHPRRWFRNRGRAGPRSTSPRRVHRRARVDRSMARAGLTDQALVGGVDQQTLDLVWSERRVGLQHASRHTGDDRRRLRRAGSLDVVTDPQRLGTSGVERAPLRPGRDNRDAWSDDVRFLDAVLRRTTRRERRNPIVIGPLGAPVVERPDRHHTRIVAGLRDRATAVPGGDDHDDAGLPHTLDRPVERVVAVGLTAVGPEREVDDADVVALPVRNDPSQGRDHGRRVGGAVPACDLERDEIRSRGCALPLAVGGRPVAGDDPGHVGAVAIGVQPVLLFSEVHAGHDAVVEVRDVGHARVDQGHPDTTPVDCGRDVLQTNKIAPHEIGLRLRLGDLTQLVTIGRRDRGQQKQAQNHGRGRPGTHRPTVAQGYRRYSVHARQLTSDWEVFGEW